ncbi:MAG TPA: allene oxide cyclase family protein [Beijerinckiaceae bacterium]|jgi:hypothetical protein|nr:allene oxide cyclase family protein [Beijerinckiaceae bacterium]
MRIKLLLAAMVAVALSTTAVTLASASGGSSSNDNDATVVTLFSTQDKSTFLDLDGSGMTAPTMGDQVVFTDVLFDHSGGREVGSDAVVCTVMKVTASAETDQCSATFSLTERGQIVVQGLVTLPSGDETGSKFVLPVTGGSDEFEGVGGQLTVEIINSKGDSNLTFHLLD